MNRITICLLALATLALLGCKKEQQVVERVYVIGERVPLHDAPEIRGEAKSIVQRGTWLEVLAAGLPDEEHGDKRLWYRVRHEGKELYLSAEEALLRYNIITFRPVSEVGLVIPLQAPYRTNPDLRAAPAGQWKKGEIVSITAEAQLSHAAGQRWLQTKLGDRSGYILATMVERAPSSEREELEKRAALDEYEAADGHLCLTVDNPKIFSDLKAGELSPEPETECSYSGADSEPPKVTPRAGDCLKVVAYAREAGKNYFRVDHQLYSRETGLQMSAGNAQFACHAQFAGWLSAEAGDFTDDLLKYRIEKSGVAEHAVLIGAIAAHLRTIGEDLAAAIVPESIEVSAYDSASLAAGERILVASVAIETSARSQYTFVFICNAESCRQPPITNLDRARVVTYQGDLYLLAEQDIRVALAAELFVLRNGAFQQIGRGADCKLEPPQFICAPNEYGQDNQPHSFVIENGTLKPVQ